ncbi:hypothetical protein [Nocardioides sp.]|uniref:hypothetical protein n=1 Tax=Nocardioides sp. TaxID=35761 RepID=UPI00271F9641|nr:hypothetical protein [Nocardioides sp.]MDO9456427.1 hypothetical protein [Nocardioides sp.]
MTTAARLGVFVAGLLVVFAAAVGIGRATGPVGPIGPAEQTEGGREVLHASDKHADVAGDGHDHGPEAATDLPGGLATSQGGYTLVPDHTTYRPGTRELAFRVEDADGAAVTDYDVEHDELLHLVAVRRDFTGFQHVHPELDAAPEDEDAGTWRVPLDLTPGSWRVFADFVPHDGDPVVLGVDLSVAGPTDLAPRAEPTRTAVVGDYEVTLDGDLTAGQHSMLSLTINRDGVPVTDLEPYLGAYGHLVALREGDLAYLHVHPEDGEPGPSVAFDAEVPSAGRYHLYLDFRHDGVVRTAGFTVEADR